MPPATDRPIASDAPAAPDAVAPIVQLNREFMRALQALKTAGEADLACRIAARGWLALLHDHPVEARRLETLLHRLAPVTPPKGAPPMPVPATPLEVRHLPPAQRHALIFETLGALKLDHAIELINDHDPKPLRYQFDAETPGQFSFTYLESGPEVWRVEIRRIAASLT